MSHTSQISTLFLDIGGVLLTNGWGRESRMRAAKHFQLDYAQLNDRHHLTFGTYEIGKLTLEEYLNRVVFYEPRSFSRQEFRDFMFAQSQQLPEMIPLVRRLKEQNRLHVVAVSNEGRELTEYRITTFRLGEFFDCFVSSCFVNYRKPDLDIYRLALDITQVQPSEVAYIDDRAMFVDLANGLGIHGIHHQSYETTCARLKALGLRF